MGLSKKTVIAFCFVGLLGASGCAVKSNQQIALSAPVAERVQLKEAAIAVNNTPWRKPESASLFARLTGVDGGDRFTRGDAVASYVGTLKPIGARFDAMMIDANDKLADAGAMRQAALSAVEAPTLSMNDVFLVEQSIQNLREQRDIFFDAADKLEDAGDPVDRDALQLLRLGYSTSIRSLSEAADILADKLEDDTSTQIAGELYGPQSGVDYLDFSDL